MAINIARRKFITALGGTAFRRSQQRCTNYRLQVVPPDTYRAASLPPI
jgi:hypothetical protein